MASHVDTRARDCVDGWLPGAGHQRRYRAAPAVRGSPDCKTPRTAEAAAHAHARAPRGGSLLQKAQALRSQA